MGSETAPPIGSAIAPWRALLAAMPAVNAAAVSAIPAGVGAGSAGLVIEWSPSGGGPPAPGAGRLVLRETAAGGELQPPERVGRGHTRTGPPESKPALLPRRDVGAGAGALEHGLEQHAHADPVHHVEVVPRAEHRLAGRGPGGGGAGAGGRGDRR